MFFFHRILIIFLFFVVLNIGRTQWVVDYPEHTLQKTCLGESSVWTASVCVGPPLATGYRSLCTGSRYQHDNTRIQKQCEPSQTTIYYVDHMDDGPKDDFFSSTRLFD